MLTLLRRGRRKPDAEPQKLELEVAEPSAGDNRLFVLIPEAGFSFRLFGFPEPESAQAFLHANVPALQQEEIVAFWALDSESEPDRPATSDQPPEAVIMIRDPRRSGVVNLYSFIDMEGARAFLRESVEGGLDLSLVLLYWAAAVSLNGSPQNQDPTQAGRTHLEPVGGWPAAAPYRAETVPSRAAATPSPAERPIDSAVSGRPDGKGQDNGKRKRQAQDRPVAPPEARADASHEIARRKRGGLIGRILTRVYLWPGWDRLALHVIAAARLKSEVYEDLRRHPAATGQAALIVGLGALAAGIGVAGSGLASVFWYALAALVGWAVSVGTAYFVGSWVLGKRSEPRRLFQAAGVASSPALLLFLGAVPVYAPLFLLPISIWVAIAMARAAASVLELDWQSEIVVAALCWSLFFAISQVAPAILVS